MGDPVSNRPIVKNINKRGESITKPNKEINISKKRIIDCDNLNTN